MVDKNGVSVVTTWSLSADLMDRSLPEVIEDRI